MEKLLKICLPLIIYLIFIFTSFNDLSQESIFYLASFLFFLSLIFMIFIKETMRINIFLLIAILNLAGIYILLNFVIGITIFIIVIISLFVCIYLYIKNNS